MLTPRSASASAAVAAGAGTSVGGGSSAPTIARAIAPTSSVLRERRHRRARAQHGDRVGDRADLVELVRDEHDRRALAREPAQRREQAIDLDGRQHRGRLVEDQRGRAVVQRRHDLRALRRAERQRLDARPRIDGQPDLRAELVQPPRGVLELEPWAALDAEHRVLDHGQRLRGGAMLLHDADLRVPREAAIPRRKRDGRPRDRQRATIGRAASPR